MYLQNKVQSRGCRSTALIVFCVEVYESCRGSFHRFRGSFHSFHESFHESHGSFRGSGGASMEASMEVFTQAMRSFMEASVEASVKDCMEDMKASMEKQNPEAFTTEAFAKPPMEVASTKVVEAAVEATSMEASTKTSTKASTKSSTKSFRGIYFQGSLHFTSMKASVASTEAQRLPRHLPWKPTPMKAFVDKFLIFICNTSTKAVCF